MLYIITIIIIINSVYYIIIVIIIIMIIIIIIISIINDILEEKEKTTWWERGFANKTAWTCLYACYLCSNFFLFVCFLVASCQKFRCFFRVYNCVCKFDKITKNYEKKNKSVKFKQFNLQRFLRNKLFCRCFVKNFRATSLQNSSPRLPLCYFLS